MPQAIKSAVYRSQVLDRTFQILDILAADGTGQGITELAERLHLHKSTTHRLIVILEASRYVEKDVTGKYRLGSRIIELGLMALSRLDIYQIAKPYLRDLMSETEETAHLGVMRDGAVISLLTCESSQTLRTPSTIGTRHAAHSSSLGKAILAFCRPDECERFLQGCAFEKYTRNTLTSRDLLLKELESTRRIGYAIDDEEREDGLRCIGAPVFSSSGETVAAVSIAGPVFRITRDRTSALAASVVKAASTISSALGYRTPDSSANP